MGLKPSSAAVVPPFTVTRASGGRASHGGRRCVRVGHSWHAGARRAGAEATLDALQLAEPRLLVVFASFGYDLPELLAGVHEVAGDVPVIGCSTAGEIGPGPAMERGVEVVKHWSDFTRYMTHSAGLPMRTREACEAVAGELSLLPVTRHTAT